MILLMFLECILTLLLPLSPIKFLISFFWIIQLVFSMPVSDSRDVKVSVTPFATLESSRP